MEVDLVETDEAALQKVREDRLLIDAVDKWLYEEIQPYLGDRVLEIGCGLGNFARHLTGCTMYIGIEASPNTVEDVRERFREHPHMIFSAVDATSATLRDYARFEVDTVFSLNVFEHIEDHMAVFEHAAHILRPGGHLILVVPAHAWLYGSIDNAIGHYRRYDRQMISECIARVGLHLVKQKYLNSVGALGWFFNGRIRRQQTPPSGQLRVFNHLVPFIKVFESIVPVPFGISLLAIAVKPAR
jgi:SAM-dependent methyltransferase